MLTGNVAPMLSGQAFLDAAHTGTFRPGDAVLPGVTVTLTGTSYLNTKIRGTTTTDSHGNFKFLLVPNGTYQLSFHDSLFQISSAGIGGHNAAAGSSVISGIVVSNGESVTGGHLAYRPGIDPQLISARMFLASSSPSAFVSATAGAGSFAVTGPVVRAGHKIPSQHLNNAATRNIDLAGVFRAPDITTSEVTFNITAGGHTSAVKVQLFDARAPQTVANFLDYVHSGAYSNSIFHRLTTKAHDGIGVLQGGAAVLQNGPTLVPITITNPGVANEFSTSNTIGTLAMAQSQGNPNSATDQFFFNVVNNAQALDHQSFTVFGKVVGAADQGVLNTLAKTPVQDESGTTFATGHPSLLLNSLPLNGTYTKNDSQFPTDTTADQYLVINSIAVTRQNEALTYTVSSSDTNVATAVIATNTSELLTLRGGTKTGTATITVTATDQFGTSKQITFTVTNP